jgi:putative DNA primase/helicase
LGEGANGKSVFLNTVQALLGEYVENFELSRFVNKNEKRWTSHAIEGKLANISADIDPVIINSSQLIKKLAAGDPVSAEIKGGISYSYKPVIKLLFSANRLPKTKDATLGFYRRLEIVEFPNQFSPYMEGYDPQLTEKLKAELPGIARWAIKGLIRFLDQNKQFTISKSMKSSKLKYMEKNEVIKLFIKGNVDVTDKKEDYIINNKLHKLYSDWAEDYGITPVSLNALTRYIEKEDIGLNEDGTTVKPINGESKRCYIGVKLKEQNKRASFEELFSEENINEFGFLE